MIDSICEDEKLCWLVFVLMQTAGLTKLYLPKKFYVDNKAPSMIITYDTDTEQYVFDLKGKERE